MRGQRPLPKAFLDGLRELARSYLASDDPCRQSGFGGGLARWRAEREPLLDAVDHDGSFLDLGCANGFLLASLRGWARERGIELDPFGLDQSSELVALARARLPDVADQLFVGNAWSWVPTRRFDYVYTLADAVPASYRTEHLRRLHTACVAPGGRLILGSYGSRSRRRPPEDVAGALTRAGLPPAGGSAAGSLPGDGPLVRFAWLDRPG